MEPNQKLIIAVCLIVISICAWFIFSPGLFDQLDELERGTLPTSVPTRPAPGTPVP